MKRLFNLLELIGAILFAISLFIFCNDKTQNNNPENKSHFDFDSDPYWIGGTTALNENSNETVYFKTTKLSFVKWTKENSKFYDQCIAIIFDSPENEEPAFYIDWKNKIITFENCDERQKVRE